MFCSHIWTMIELSHRDTCGTPINTYIKNSPGNTSEPGSKKMGVQSYEKNILDRWGIGPPVRLHPFWRVLRRPTARFGSYQPTERGYTYYDHQCLLRAIPARTGSPPGGFRQHFAAGQ